MSVAAVMLVKDEADIIRHTLDHLCGQVDFVYVSDNGSTDGTLEILQQYVRENPTRVMVELDPDPAYWQSRKTSRLARIVGQNGYDWVIPCDADEYWYAPDGRPLRDWLAGVAPDVAFVTAALYNHIPTGRDRPALPCQNCGDTGRRRVLGTPMPGAEMMDCGCGSPSEKNPFRRIGWKQPQPGPLPKVACRTLPDLEIAMGNHDAWASGAILRVAGLEIRHYSWRSEAQYLRKIRNGERAYAATNMPESTGRHWRMFAGKPDEAVTDHFRQWFWKADPAAAGLVYDPAPVAPPEPMPDAPPQDENPLR